MSHEMQFHSRVGDDGVLKLQVDLGLTEAQRDVLVTILPLPAPSTATSGLSWSEIIAQTYGSCAGMGLERPEQGTYENREPLT